MEMIDGKDISVQVWFSFVFIEGHAHGCKKSMGGRKMLGECARDSDLILVIQDYVTCTDKVVQSKESHADGIVDKTGAVHRLGAPQST